MGREGVAPPLPPDLQAGLPSMLRYIERQGGDSGVCLQMWMRAIGSTIARGQFLNLVPESSTRSRPSESNCTLLCGFCECCRRLYPRLRQDTLGTQYVRRVLNPQRDPQSNPVVGG